MDWVDILVPGAAILALLGVIGLVIQSIRHGRAIRRVEERAALGGGSSSAVSLARLEELQARIEGRAPRTPVRDGEEGGAGAGRRVGVALGLLVVLALAGAGAWYMFLRDDDPGTTAGGTTERTVSTTAAPPPPSAVGQTGRVPRNPPPLENKASYTVAVYNASGVAGAARTKVAPLVSAAGYILGPVENATAQDPSTSVVMWAKGRRVVGWNVAKDLGITKATPLDGGFSENGLGDVDAVVIVGLDLANG